ncbi:hypothetical protein TVAG_157890 [Trichomonas vaginalis G3]|uniref:Tubby C-terminal domain-containing protein n=1 Tax=Trichomonas vaginalis (strain ATCC PRA-98 / G3) TaxID=412133 RepID=A2FBC4_TRIV3|nr:hypothetical protein TVAGG3_0232150 [Trichomonas vaginalis G3]EAX97804.1 hypothetical protein TVAG_157890 [Trichomonas vaginalis G3]KAI5552720.1 hypothetical protein TVAGG3_0232150 [Trichomonas vaginalis G3]|eukprot:XP_001310734.1 hypothetical protein [Trichomonas vaginalis G3]
MSLFAVDIGEGEENDIEKPVPIFLKRNDNDVRVRNQRYKISPKRRNKRRQMNSSKSVNDLTEKQIIEFEMSEHSAVNPSDFELIDENQENDKTTIETRKDHLGTANEIKETAPLQQKTDPHIIDQDINAISHKEPDNQVALHSSTLIKNEITEYSVTRETKMRINGKSIYFVMKQNNSTVYAAKYKQKFDIIPIFRDLENTHFHSKATDYVINIGKGNHDFSLRTKTRIGRELLSIRYFTQYDFLARSSILTFFSISNSDPFKLVSLNYVKTKFEKNFPTKSVKNAIYCQKNENDPIILVKKVGKNELIIQNSMNIDPIYPFALAISAFLCSIT